MKRKILLGILSIFMSLAVFAGVMLFSGDNLILPKDDTIETGGEAGETEVKTTPSTKDKWNDEGNLSWNLNMKADESGVMWVEIGSGIELANFSAYVYSDSKILASSGAKYDAKKCNVKLVKNIDISAHYWIPIGNYASKFSGIFDGNGYTITGLFLDGNDLGRETNAGKGSKNYGGFVSGGYNFASGLFGFTDGATIKNFKLVGGHSDLVTWAREKNDDENNYYIGSVLGKGDNTTISNVVVSHSINVEGEGDDNYENVLWWKEYGKEVATVYIGGIAGLCTKIEDCIVEERLLPSSKYGLCINFTDLFNSEQGFAGWIGIERWNNTWGAYHIGGIVGVAWGQVTGCYNYQTISTNSEGKLREYAAIKKFYTGGIVGYSHGNITACNNHGMLDIWGTVFNGGDWDCTDIYYLGGIVGHSDKPITYSYNYGDIYCKTVATVGGVVGACNQNISWCGNFGNIDAPGVESTDYDSDDVRSCGGIVGVTGTFEGDTKGGTISNCVNYGSVTGLRLDKFQDLPTHPRGFGGIVGVGYKTKILKCINYGNVWSAFSNTGGIVGNVDGPDDKSDTTLIKGCVNFGLVKDVKHLSATTWIKRWVNSAITENEFDTEIVECYYATGSGQEGGSNTGNAVSYNSLGKLSFFNTYANWKESGQWDLSAFESSLVSYGSNLTQAWFESSLVADYMKKKNGTTGSYTDYDYEINELEFCMVPTAAVARMCRFESGVVDDFVDEEYITTNSIENQSASNQTHFVYLRGVEYENDYYDKFSISLKTGHSTWFSDFQIKLEQEGLGFIDKYSIENSSIVQPESAKYYFKIRLCPSFSFANIYDPATGDSFKTFNYKFEATAKKQKLKIKFVNKAEGVEQTVLGFKTGFIIFSESEKNLASWQLEDELGNKNSTGGFYYGTKLNLDIEPLFGYKFVGIDTLLLREEKRVNNNLFNIHKASGIEGPATETFILDGVGALTTLYLFFDELTYDVNVTYYDENDVTSTNRVNVEYEISPSSSIEMVFDNERSKTDGKYDKFESAGYYSYGYVYEVVYGQSETNILSFQLDKVETDDNLIGISWAAVASAVEKDHQGDVQYYPKTSEGIDISVFRTPIEYTFSTTKYADRYNNFLGFEKYVDDYAGSIPSIEGGFIATNDVNLGEVVPNSGFDYKESKINNVTYDLFNSGSSKMLDILKDLYTAGVLTKDSDLDKDNVIINIDVYFQLMTYSISGCVTDMDGNIVIDNEDDNDNHLDEAVTWVSTLKAAAGTTAYRGDLSAISDKTKYTDGGETKSHMRYYAPITLTAKDCEDKDCEDCAKDCEDCVTTYAGYKFAGYYLKTGGEYKLLSTNKVYTFVNDPTISLTEQICIVAKYDTFDTGSAPASSVLKKDAGGYTLSNTYTITEAKHLAWVSNQVVTGQDNFENDIIRLANDIDMSKVRIHSIGTAINPFKGTFDGNGFVIKNLSLVDGGGIFSNMGFFGTTSGATLKDFALVGGSACGYANVGGIVGSAENTIIENVNNKSCAVTVSDVKFYDIYGEQLAEEKYLSSYVQIFYKQNSDDVEKICYYYFDLEDGKVKEGDAGYNAGESKYVPQEITTADFAIQTCVGGAVGKANGGEFAKLSNYATVTYADNIDCVAGLVGEVVTTWIELSFNEGQLSKLGSSEAEPVKDVTISMFANGEIDATNCYYRNGTAMYLYNATLSNGERYSGDYSVQVLDNSIWMKIYTKYVLRDFYWA